MLSKRLKLKAVTSSTTSLRAATEPIYEATDAELSYIKEVLSKFEELGLRRNLSLDLPFQVYADAIVEGYPVNDSFGDESNRITDNAPFPELTVLCSNSEELDLYQHYFSNAVLFMDHGFDGVSNESHLELLKHILAISKEEWQAEVTSVADPRFTVTIEHDLKSSVLTISPTKDFDFEFFQKLNALIPADVSGRFGFSGDGGHILVVWLPIESFPAFNDYCRIEFYS